MSRAARSALTCCLALCPLAASLGESTQFLAPLVTPDGQLSAAWQFTGLPDQTIARTTFDVHRDATGPAVHVTARHSYGALLHSMTPAIEAQTLRWRWRAVRLNGAADLRRKDGDDLSLKVCVMFDLPLHTVPLVERWLLELARLRTGLALPAATLCYGWDHRLPPETLLENVYSRRVRILILRQGLDIPTQWHHEQRDLARDFRAAFGVEPPGRTPAVTAVAIGADSDNTGGDSEGDIADVALMTLSPQ